MSPRNEPVNCGCGGEANVGEVHFWGRCYTVQCSKCGIETKLQNSKAEAIQTWNRAMGNRMELQTVKERTAKVIEHDGVVTMDGKKYHHMEYLCENCKKKVIGGDEYCSHCGCRLDWDEDIPMEYFENGGI